MSNLELGTILEKNLLLSEPVVKINVDHTPNNNINAPRELA